MSDNVISLDSQRPHVTVCSLSGNVHVIPVAVLEKISFGDMDITKLEMYEQIVPTIVGEWLKQAGGLGHD